MESKKFLGSYRELRDHFCNLDSQYNHLEIKLLDLEQADQDGHSTYVMVTENYDFSHGGPYNRQGQPSPNTKVEIFGEGPYEIGQPFKPCGITLKVDGHSFVRSDEKKADWPNYFNGIKNRVRDIIEEGYVVESFKVLKNQKDDFPGDLDADEELTGILKL